MADSLIHSTFCCFLGAEKFHSALLGEPQLIFGRQTSLLAFVTEKRWCWCFSYWWQMEINRVYSTRHSIRYSSRGRGLSLPLLPGVEVVDNGLLPPPPKKKTRTLYSTGNQTVFLSRCVQIWLCKHFICVCVCRSVRAFRGLIPGGPLSRRREEESHRRLSWCHASKNYG